MSKYTIKPYFEGIEEEQSRVSIEIGKRWIPWTFGFRVYDLQEFNADPRYDPEARFFGYSGDKMVGFIQARTNPPDEDGLVQAGISWAWALPGHEEITPLLIEEELKTLRDKGVDLVRAAASTVWPGSFEFLESLGFQERPDRKRGFKLYYTYDLSNGPLDISTENVQDFDLERDLDQTAELAAHWYNNSVEWCKEYLAGKLNCEWGELIAHLVLREDDEMVAACAAAPNFITGKDPSAIYYIYTRDDKCLRPLVAKVIERCIQADYKILLVDLINEHRPYEETYKEMGFKWAAEFGQYEMRL